MVDRVLSFTDQFYDHYPASVDSLYLYRGKDIAQWLINLIHSLITEVAAAEIYSNLWARHQFATSKQSEILSFIQQKHLEAMSVRHSGMLLKEDQLLMVNHSLFYDLGVMDVIFDIFCLSLDAVIQRQGIEMMEKCQHRVGEGMLDRLKHDIAALAQNIQILAMDIVATLRLILRGNGPRNRHFEQVKKASDQLAGTAETWDHLQGAIECLKVISEMNRAVNVRVIGDTMSSQDWATFQNIVGALMPTERYHVVMAKGIGLPTDTVFMGIDHLQRVNSISAS